MIKFIVFLVCVFLSLGANSQDKKTIILTIDGKEYAIEEGEELQLREVRSSPILTARVADNKKFESSYLSFTYPTNFSYSYEEDISYRNWTLDGNDFVIMYFEMDVETDLNDFVNEMVSQFGKEKCKTSPTEVVLGEKTLKGTRIEVSMIGQRLSIDLLGIINNEFKSRIIVFQDSIGEEGGASIEKIKTLNVIDQSIQYK